ncbi:MAG: sodium:proton antiporter [Proteobacteria bacterium]|nr:sodium:proton antiporter [Pseudomonadota bacterium]
MLELPAIILVCVSIFGYLNYRFLRLPLTVGLALIALIAGILVLTTDTLLPQIGVSAQISAWLNEIDFNRTLMHGMLSFLLFAGALHVDLNGLLKAKLHVSLLATAGVLISTFLNGLVFYFVTGFFGYEIKFIYCLIFGVIVSPTDPVAVMALLKRLKVPKQLEAIIGGESLFNDGVAVVVFSVLVTIAFGSTTGIHSASAPDANTILGLFVRDAFGGALLGIVAGYTTFLLMRQIDDYVVEIIATLALVTGAYSLAIALHISGPIAMVIAGVFIGNTGRNLAMSEKTQVHVTDFWHLVDEILNAALFVLIGFQVIMLSSEISVWIISAISVGVAVVARWIAVATPLTFLSAIVQKERGEISILTWAGLKGGISIALALSLPDTMEYKGIILTAAYAVVVFSILIQGLTIEKLITHYHGGDDNQKQT